MQVAALFLLELKGIRWRMLLSLLMRVFMHGTFISIRNRRRPCSVTFPAGTSTPSFFFNSSRAIVKYTFSKQLGSGKLLKVGWTITEYLFHCVEFSDCHLVFCESSRLICTDGVSTSHSLWRSKFAHPIVLSLHFHDRESEGNSHSERKTLRDRDNNYCHGCNNCKKKIS